MKWVEAKIIFDFHDIALAEELIANLFFDFGLRGVVVEEPGIDPPEGWGKDPILPKFHSVTGYFPKNGSFEKSYKAFERRLAILEMESGIRCRVVSGDVDETDWAESWKAYFRPEKISEKLVVKPTWLAYSGEQNEIVLEIDPGMAFGTGTHPTTRMCITLIEKYLQPGDWFLDVGAGSGILMIAASKLGAGGVWGTDNDICAIHVARRNLIQNRINKATFNIIPCNLVEKVEKRFNFIVANITSRDICILLDSVKRVLVDDGIFVCSGITEDSENLILEKIQNLGFALTDMLTEDGWVAMACRRAV